jgi:hypothetical protein
MDEVCEADEEDLSQGIAGCLAERRNRWDMSEGRKPDEWCSSSNGPFEGKINKLKSIKRSMYGRGGFPLLRQKVLKAA